MDARVGADVAHGRAVRAVYGGRSDITLKSPVTQVARTGAKVGCLGARLGPAVRAYFVRSDITGFGCGAGRYVMRGERSFLGFGTCSRGLGRGDASAAKRSTEDRFGCDAWARGWRERDCGENKVR